MFIEPVFIGACYVPDILLATEDMIVNKVLLLPSLHSSGGDRKQIHKTKKKKNYRACHLWKIGALIKNGK